jgi:hypothetical protein
VSHLPYPDRDRALRQIARHDDACLRDPDAYELRAWRVADEDATHDPDPHAPSGPATCR